jgi:regulator of protease activity HflC (stomatin/prohibitin superfamily)
MDPGMILSMLALVMLGLSVTSVRLVRGHQRSAVFRDGQVIRVSGPGLVFHVPLLERPVKVDTAPFKLDIPPEWLGATGQRIEAPTVRFVMRVADPAELLTYAAAGQNVFVDTWEALESAITDEIPAGTPVADSELERRLDDARVRATRRTQHWGLQISSVEIGSQ